jgi:hypothetical protein
LNPQFVVLLQQPKALFFVNNIKQLIVADEIRYFSKLKQEGILSDEEFTEMKEDVFNNNRNENSEMITPILIHYSLYV